MGSGRRGSAAPRASSPEAPFNALSCQLCFQPAGWRLKVAGTCRLGISEEGGQEEGEQRRRRGGGVEGVHRDQRERPEGGWRGAGEKGCRQRDNGGLGSAGHHVLEGQGQKRLR